MTRANRLTKAEEILLDVLTWRVRVATRRQLANIFQEIAVEGGVPDRQLKSLGTAGLIDRASVALRIVAVTRPLFAWRRGRGKPNFDALAWSFHKRWNSAPVRRVTVCWATAAAVQLWGGVGGSIRQPTQIEHDLGTMAAYVARLRTDPAGTARWVSEDVLLRESSAKARKSLLRRVPDAAIVRANGSIELAIEFGGQYGAWKLRRWHNHCQRYRIAYEIW